MEYGKVVISNLLAIIRIWHTIPAKAENSRDRGMTREKRIILGAGLFGICFWGGVGFVLGGWEGARISLISVGLIACVAHTFGSVWRYFSQ